MNLSLRKEGQQKEYGVRFNPISYLDATLVDYLVEVLPEVLFFYSYSLGRILVDDEESAWRLWRAMGDYGIPAHVRTEIFPARAESEYEPLVEPDELEP